MSDFLFDVSTPPTRTGRPVTKISPRVKRAIQSAPHLTAADAGLVALVELLATHVDRASKPGDLTMMSKELRAALADAGMTPAARSRIGLSGEEEVDPIAILRGTVDRVPLRSVE